MNIKKKGSQTINCYNILKRMIITLELKPGEVLHDKELEKKSGFGRTPIREAIVKLRAQGLISSRPNESPYVKEITFKGVRDFFIPFMTVEKLVARLAVQNITQEELNCIRAINQTINKAIEKKDLFDIWAQNRCFHSAIAKATDNEYVITIHDNLRDQAERLSYLAISQEIKTGPSLKNHLKKIGSQHQEILSAIENQDVRRSEILAVEHVNLFRQKIMNFLN